MTESENFTPPPRRAFGRGPEPAPAMLLGRGGGVESSRTLTQTLSNLSTLVDPLVVNDCTVLTMDADRNEYPVGHVVLDGNRIVSVGPGAAPLPKDFPARYLDGRGCVLTPGLINTHHHLYQWLTRGLAVDSTLFQWLRTLYPIWAGLDEELVHIGATGALAQLAATGCTTTTDHHYVFPRDGGDLLAAEIAAATEVGMRFHPCRGSMDLGVSAGGLPPDQVVESIDAILAATGKAIEDWHDPSFDSMLRIGVAPCSPFSVTDTLLRESATLAREAGVRLHTHVAETDDENEYCAQRFGMTPVAYLESLGWTGPDVWYAHGVHLDNPAITALADTGTGVAHCPSSNGRLGAGIARTAELCAAGVPLGLGVDGAASNEGSDVLREAHQAVLLARALGGPQALSLRAALELATIGGARVLGRENEIGSLEVGKLGDLVLWRTDDVAHAGIADPVAALLLGATPTPAAVVINGRMVVEDGQVLTVDSANLAARVAAAHHTLLDKSHSKAG